MFKDTITITAPQALASLAKQREVVCEVSSVCFVGTTSHLHEQLHGPYGKHQIAHCSIWVQSHFCSVVTSQCGWTLCFVARSCSWWALALLVSQLLRGPLFIQIFFYPNISLSQVSLAGGTALKVCLDLVESPHPQHHAARDTSASAKSV